MAQATEIKKLLIDLVSPAVESLESLENLEVEERSIEKEIKKGKQVKLKKFSKLLSKIIKKSKYNANYLKETIPIKKISISNTSYRTYAVY